MSQVGLIIIEFIGALFLLLILIFGFYWCGKNMWITLTKNYFNILFKDEKIKNLAFFIKEKRLRYFVWVLFVIFFSYFLIGFFSWLCIFTDEMDAIVNKSSEKHKDLILIICLSSILFVITNLLILILINKFYQQLKQFGIYSKKIAIEKFKYFHESIEKDKLVTTELLNVENSILNQYYFQYQQKKYQKKIKKLKDKKDQTNYDFKLLIYFINYLRTHAHLCKWIENPKYFTEINRKTINTNPNISIIINILINKFFAFVNEAEKNILT